MSRIKTFVCLIIISVVASTMTVLPLPSHVLAEPNTRVVGYFVSWAVYGRDFHVAAIPAEKLTHINYAFANISDAGEIVLGDPYADIDKFYPGDSWDQGALRGSFHQLQILKAAHPHLKTLISVGGWSWSDKFSDVALTQQSRQKFAKSCVDFITQYGFDGVDIDWEYPVSGGKEPGRPEDKVNYTLLLEELRNQLDVQGIADSKHYLLTIASPAAEATYNNIELDNIYQYLDWINLMTYDYNGGWSQLTDFNAPLYHHPDDSMGEKFNINYTVNAYLASGIPDDKLVMGVPFYGIGWSGVPNVNNGLFQQVGGVPDGTWEKGMFDYWDIKDNYIGNGYTRYWSSDSKVPWLYNPQNGIMISYDDPESLGIKAQYVEDNNLGGVMIWELSSDDSNDSLLNSLTNNLPEWAPQPVYSVSRQAAHDSIGVTAPGTTWYLAEGSTGTNDRGTFETWVLVANPGDDPATVAIDYQTDTNIEGPRLTLAPHTRQTVEVAATVPNEFSVSTTVTSDNPVIAERSMYWNSPSTFRQAAHDSIGVTAPGTTWYLAEGSTGTNDRGTFETWVLVANPGDDPATVAIDYQTDTNIEGPRLTLAPHTRQTVEVAATVPNEFSVSTTVTSDNPVIAERSMYWNSPSTFRQAAHDSIGVTAPGTTWYLAEGSTGTNDRGTFETWVLVANPGDDPATVAIDYQTDTNIEGPRLTLAPHTRQTVEVAATVPNEFSVSTTVTSDNPVIAERSMYWNSPSTFRQAAHDSIGITSPRKELYLAEGSTGEDSDGMFETWVLVQNSGDQVAEVDLFYQTPTQEIQGPRITLEPHTRQTVSVGDTVPYEWSVSTRVVSDHPVIAERAMYWNSY